MEEDRLSQPQVAQPQAGQDTTAQPQAADQGATLVQRRAATKRRPIEDVHLDELLDIIVQQESSDLHLAVGLPAVMRVDGALKPMNYEPMTGSVMQRMLYDILSDEQVQRFETNLELDFSYALQEVARFRCNIFMDKGELAGAFRLIPTKIPTIDELLLPKVLHDLVKLPRGFVLVTGPTGSGKSTTLAAMVDEINESRHEHIITIEDPIEYLHNHKRSIINQRELGHDTWKFENALRSALREDPDVLLVGEMRDIETMALAITCAETGHLVFATLHTNNAAESIDRVIDVFPPGQQEQIRIQLSNNLGAVLSQQLLPRAGQPGRVVAVECMVATAAIRNLIREAKAHQITSIVQTSAEHGMLTMDQALRDLYQSGMITYEVALEHAMNREELQKLMRSREA